MDPRFDPGKPWYHGSPRKVTTLRAGSTITQDRELARIFSHKPALVVGEEANKRWKHTGPFARGFLYRVVGQITECDIERVPHSSLSPGMEWNTRREFALELVAETTVKPEELLTRHELREMAARGLVESTTVDTILTKQDLPE
ncbi:MAG: hypothetical protein MUF78_01320 [Candidatus Edwardsbacteria bacterium]|jgi:hypothetical protein|nr:hypothetical protein [Candidatus Edwardsbacteria bacterium]